MSDDGYTEQEIKLFRLTMQFTSDPGDVSTETVRAERRGWLATLDAATEQAREAEKWMRVEHEAREQAEADLAAAQERVGAVAEAARLADVSEVWASSDSDMPSHEESEREFDYALDAMRDVLTPTPPPTPAAGEHPEDRCDVCGGPNVCWSTPNEVWNLGGAERGGIECPACFVKKASAAGIHDGAWDLRPERDAAVEQAQGAGVDEVVPIGLYRGAVRVMWELAKIADPREHGEPNMGLLCTVNEDYQGAVDSVVAALREEG